LVSDVRGGGARDRERERIDTWVFDTSSFKRLNYVNKLLNDITRMYLAVSDELSCLFAMK
jgi:hypothetical protein